MGETFIVFNTVDEVNEGENIEENEKKQYHLLSMLARGPGCR